MQVFSILSVCQQAYRKYSSSISKLTAWTEKLSDKNWRLKLWRFVRNRFVRILIFVYGLYKYLSSILNKNDFQKDRSFSLKSFVSLTTPIWFQKGCFNINVYWDTFTTFFMLYSIKYTLFKRSSFKQIKREICWIKNVGD